MLKTNSLYWKHSRVLSGSLNEDVYAFRCCTSVSLTQFGKVQDAHYEFICQIKHYVCKYTTCIMKTNLISISLFKDWEEKDVLCNVGR